MIDWFWFCAVWKGKEWERCRLVLRVRRYVVSKSNRVIMSHSEEGQISGSYLFGLEMLALEDTNSFSIAHDRERFSSNDKISCLLSGVYYPVW